MIRTLTLALLVGLAQIANGQPSDKINGKSAPEWIDTLKTHQDAKFRRVALIVLEVYGPRTQGVLPAVTGALEADSDAQVRREAAMLLGRMGEEAKASIPALGDALKSDKSELVREAAAQALAGKLNPHAGEQVRVLAEALNDSHQGTRTAAAEAILKLGDKAGPALPALMTLAKDPKSDRFARQYALKCISRLGAENRDVAQILIATLRDASNPLPLREEAADGLGRSTVATDIVLPPLAEMLTDPALEVRRAAAAGLARQGKDAEIVWPKIEAGLKNPDAPVRHQLIRLCGQLAKALPAASTALIEHSKKDDLVENRLAAIQELGELGDQASDAVRTALVDLSNDDPMAVVRTAAAAALKKIDN